MDHKGPKNYVKMFGSGPFILFYFFALASAAKKTSNENSNANASVLVIFIEFQLTNPKEPMEPWIRDTHKKAAAAKKKEKKMGSGVRAYKAFQRTFSDP